MLRQYYVQVTQDVWCFSPIHLVCCMQCFINGDFVGGSDILLEMFESGELQTMLTEAKKKA